jgi:alpha-beta hydrolase superfamily lysophospholipase
MSDEGVEARVVRLPGYDAFMRTGLTTCASKAPRLIASRGSRIAALSLLLAGCASLSHTPGPGAAAPRLDDAGAASFLASDDGLRLPLRRFVPPGEQPRAVLLALHGFNDYSRAFDGPGEWFAARGVALYAYDQRGFGAGPEPGLWPGATRLAADARIAAELLRQRYPGVPVYVLGESMGGAVALVASAHGGLPVDGLILVAPAVWARGTQPWYQRFALSVAAGLWPGGKISARALQRQVSDNPQALEILEGDPLVIKKVRFDTISGLVDLMDQALAAAPSIEQPVLLLYGGRDRIIPREPVDLFWERLPAGRQRIRYDYPGGWHLLLRDLEAERVYEDIMKFLDHRPSAGPVG